MLIHLQYGRDGLSIEIPSSNVTVIEPRFLPGIPDEAAAFKSAVREPIGAKPLREQIKSTDKVAVVIPDITRPLPTERILPWVFEELSHVPAENFTIINGTGSHRINTPKELEAMVGAEVAKKYKIVNHNSHEMSTLAFAGKVRVEGSGGVSAPTKNLGEADPAVPSPLEGEGRRERSERGVRGAVETRDVYFTREYVEADKRIVMGFIEPHFMAGFSGGYKGIFPAVADIASIMHYHRASVIGDANSTWGVLDGNPTQSQIRVNGALLPVHFCINVTQNRKREITKFFCGDCIEAHVAGCAFAKATVMRACKEPFPIVITTNGGYPLDQNLYQAVKGMSAAAQIVKQDGLILQASKCNDGFPTHGNFRKLLFESKNPRELLDRILAPGFSMYDQWEAQLLAIIELKARVGLYSDIPADEVRRAHLEPLTDFTDRISEELTRIGKDAPIAVLPEGPMTIPYLEN